ncbi:MAG TPA: TlyA family RNA methyltransferase, partial [Herpetosiphonaceae bacterium]|nr:TlyA family RNA methyltransferase [Herpetosiphonaceae bacterium]
MAAVKKQRLDLVMVERQLAPTRAKAQALIMAGDVSVGGEPSSKAGTLIDPTAPIEVRAALPYVGRGGLKLAHALDTFGLDPAGLVGLDVGACTGGFTDVLLQRGAAHVYAVDVGYGQLDWKLRQDARVTTLERTNVRYLEVLPTDGEPLLADCGVVDVSFISLGLVLPAMLRLLSGAAWIAALVKPQFEAGPELVGKGGIVRDPAVHRMVLEQVTAAAARAGLATL